jgi:hypothetical protein
LIYVFNFRPRVASTFSILAVRTLLKESRQWRCVRCVNMVTIQVVEG